MSSAAGKAAGTVIALYATLVSLQKTLISLPEIVFMSTAKAGGYGLRSNCLSFIEILSQSVANISPTLTPVVIVPFVFASAGNGTWLTYLVATAALMLVGLSINEFAKRSASPGALYVCIGHGLGPSMGLWPVGA